MRRGLFALLLLLLAACGGPASRSYTSPRSAIEGWLDTAAAVVNGTWLVRWPWQSGFPPFPKAALRAGDASGQLFAFPDVWAAPIVKE